MAQSNSNRLSPIASSRRLVLWTPENNLCVVNASIHRKNIYDQQIKAHVPGLKPRSSCFVDRVNNYRALKLYFSIYKVLQHQ